ncbi:hypothetical protein [Massilia sp. TWR1-2-2]|uniref:hypothetical protein n=1 Tax=Massilia sp. TWR1-2-2 TaxID=2804584 RepID=UPI003CFAF142
MRDITSSASDRAIVHSIVSPTDSLAFAVMAEGVETLAQLVVPRELGRDDFQGCLLGGKLLAKATNRAGIVIQLIVFSGRMPRRIAGRSVRTTCIQLFQNRKAATAAKR